MFKLTRDTLTSANLKFEDSTSADIGQRVVRGFEVDNASRQLWLSRIEAASNFALQVVREKNSPWPGAANVAFPLVSLAALQFHSRAYPAIVPASRLVRYKSHFLDPQGELEGRAERIGKHMTYQLMDVSSNWEESHDRLLLMLPILGSVFKKTYYDGVTGKLHSVVIHPRDFVLDYWAQSLEMCTRKTHVYTAYWNEIREKVVLGLFNDVLEEGGAPQVSYPWMTADLQTRKGMTDSRDEDTPYILLEQHCLMDLDEDGYKEPYIITVELSSHAVLRVVTAFEDEDRIQRFRGKIFHIEPNHYFTHYEFMPSVDGGIYGLGFGTLLGPLNAAVNSLTNQLIDAGRLSNAAGGFITRGIKMASGSKTIDPFSWTPVNASGDDLSKAFFPLPVREPSQVLYTLLSLLVAFTSKLSGTTDTMVGENPGQNTPATTSQTMVEQGYKIFAAAFKRIWRATKTEFQHIYEINKRHLPHPLPGISKEDYSGPSNLLTPMADPAIESESFILSRATALKQAAANTPGYNDVLVEHTYLRALHIDNPELYYPGPGKVPPKPNPKVQIESLKAQMKEKELQMKMQQFILELAEEKKINEAKILEMEARAAKIAQETKGAEASIRLKAIHEKIELMKHHSEILGKAVEGLKETENEPGGEHRVVGRLEEPSGDQGVF